MSKHISYHIYITINMISKYISYHIYLAFHIWHFPTVSVSLYTHEWISTFACIIFDILFQYQLHFTCQQIRLRPVNRSMYISAFLTFSWVCLLSCLWYIYHAPPRYWSSDEGLQHEEEVLWKSFPYYCPYVWRSIHLGRFLNWCCINNKKDKQQQKKHTFFGMGISIMRIRCSWDHMCNVNPYNILVLKQHPVSVWESKFLEYSPENRCLLYLWACARKT